MNAIVTKSWHQNGHIIAVSKLTVLDITSNVEEEERTSLNKLFVLPCFKVPKRTQSGAPLAVL